MAPFKCQTLYQKTTAPDLVMVLTGYKNKNITAGASSVLYVCESPEKGRGVYTDKKIERDSLIERCPVLVIPASEVEIIAPTILYNYYFCWGKDQKQGAIALGLGSVYNHSYTPNAVYIPRLEEKIIEFVAIKKILANDEITINYNGTPNDRSTLWNAGEIAWTR